MPGHPLPPQEAWDAFCDMLDQGAPWVAALAAQGTSPEPELTGEQYGVGMLLSAIEGLLVNSGQPEEFILLSQRLTTAWEHLRNGRLDPLLVIRGGAGRRSPEQGQTWFRAELCRLIDDQIAARPGTTVRTVAAEIERALRQAQAPKGHIPSAGTIRNLHGQAANPRTPTGRQLAEVRRSIESSPPEGTGVEERVHWVLGEVARWPGARP
jgi:hypothetical protein